MEYTIQQHSQIREERAKAILEHGEPEKVDEITYLVPSQFDSSKKYKVTHLDSYSCECKDFQERCKGTGIYCKHIKAIILFQKLKVSCEVAETNLQKELIIEQPLSECCPVCASQNLIKRGIRMTSIGEKQRYSCKDCKKRFVLSPIPKIKGNSKLVCLAMDCYFKGLSYRDISDQFKQFYGLSISHEAIRGWVLKFSQVMDKYSKTLTPQTSGIWNADETLILTKRGQEGSNKYTGHDFVWNVMDNETKFLLASECSGRSRKSSDAEKVMKMAYKQSGSLPYQIITDKYPGYQDGIRKAFKNWGTQRKIKHTSIVGQRRIVNNNAIENQHTHQKEFHKVRKGVTKVQEYQDGYRTFHNFVRKGVKDRRTPAERCGISLKGNRWETMLLNSLNNQKPSIKHE